jgi:hypothetical protein
MHLWLNDALMAHSLTLGCPTPYVCIPFDNFSLMVKEVHDVTTNAWLSLSLSENNSKGLHGNDKSDSLRIALFIKLQTHRLVI